MGYITEFTTFAVKLGKEARAEEWMQVLHQRQAECVDTLGLQLVRFFQPSNHRFTAPIVPGVADGLAIDQANPTGNDMNVVMILIRMAIHHVLTSLKTHSFKVILGDRHPLQRIQIS